MPVRPKGVFIIIKYIIWDFDGSLFDTYPSQIDVLIEIMQEDYSLKLSPEYIQHLTQVCLKYTFKTIADKYDIEKEELMDKFEIKCSRISPEEQKPMLYAREVCKKIIKVGGKNFINTHRDRESLEELISYFEMSDYFSEIVTRESGFPRKPDPGSFKYIKDKYDLDISETLAVGDRRLDIEGARKAGLKTFYLGNDNGIIIISDYHADSSEKIFELI